MLPFQRGFRASGVKGIRLRVLKKVVGFNEASCVSAVHQHSQQLQNSRARS